MLHLKNTHEDFNVIDQAALKIYIHLQSLLDFHFQVIQLQQGNAPLYVGGLKKMQSKHWKECPHIQHLIKYAHWKQSC